MNRREFTITVGGLVFSCGAVAQQRRVQRIGVLWHAGNTEEEKTPLGALVDGLRDVGYIDGQTMTLDNRFPNEEPARFKLLAAELVASRPDILVTVTRQAAIAAKQETTSIPIFFLSVPDPVESGLVASLAHPGGNITGEPRRIREFESFELCLSG
jgi:putative tryptophan/tyrosine transport system substrate-binding protein